MECHGLEMKGPIRSSDGIDAIEIESGTGKVIINEALQLDFGTPPTVNYDKTLAADTNGNATWQTRSAPKNTIMLFLMDSAPTGWTRNDTFTNNSMLVYQTGDNITSGGSDSPISWTTAISTNTTGSPHTHTYSGTTDPAPTSGECEAGNNDFEYYEHDHDYSGTTTTVGSSHTHGVNQDTFAPKYQTVIAATKD